MKLFHHFIICKLEDCRRASISTVACLQTLFSIFLAYWCVSGFWLGFIVLSTSMHQGAIGGGGGGLHSPLLAIYYPPPQVIKSYRMNVIHQRHRLGGKSGTNPVVRAGKVTSAPNTSIYRYINSLCKQDLSKVTQHPQVVPSTDKHNRQTVQHMIYFGARITKTAKETAQAFRQHFERVFNQDRHVDLDFVNDKLEQQPMIEPLDQPIAREEVVEAVKSLQNLKAPGEDGLLSEVWKIGEKPIDYLTEVCNVGLNGEIPCKDCPEVYVRGNQEDTESQAE